MKKYVINKNAYQIGLGLRKAGKILMCTLVLLPFGFWLWLAGWVVCEAVEYGNEK